MKINFYIKFTIFLFASVISLNVHSQKINNFNNASENIENILSGKLPNDQPNIFISDIATIDTILKSSKKRYKIIYFFSVTCHSSLLIFPQILNFVKEHNDFELYPVIGYKEIDTALYFNYLLYYRFFTPIFMLDTRKYGCKRNPFSRLRKLADAACTECVIKKMGFSSFYILDENLKTVLHTNYMIAGLKKMEYLNEWYNSSPVVNTH